MAPEPELWEPRNWNPGTSGIPGTQLLRSKSFTRARSLAKRVRFHGDGPVVRNLQPSVPLTDGIPGRPSTGMYARIARQPVVLASIFAGYFLLGRLGLSLGAPEAAVTAIWPPSGLALVAFLLFGSGVWPALLLGSMFVRLIASGDIVSSIGIASGTRSRAIWPRSSSIDSRAGRTYSRARTRSSASPRSSRSPRRSAPSPA